MLIALLAVSHKFIIVDVKETGPATLFALAAILALGVVYWLVRDHDRRILREHEAVEADAEAERRTAPRRRAATRRIGGRLNRSRRPW